MSDTKNKSIPSPLVDETVAAERLGISVSWLRKDRLTRSIGVPFHRFGEGRRCAVRYDATDLERFIAEKRVA